MDTIMIGNKLKEIRQTNKLTQAEFGEHFGVSKASVSQYENNIYEPDLKLIKAVCLRFNRSADWLLDIKNSPK